MCGRYALTLPLEAMRQLFQFDGQPNLAPLLDVRPTSRVAVIRHGPTGQRQIMDMRWGFVPRFAKTIDPRPLINARAETIADKPSFRDAFRKRRCIVPMDFYYEWQAPAEPKAPKQPYAIARADGQMMAAGAIWETWRAQDGTLIDTMAIITRAPDPEIAAIHDRMPIEIAIDDLALWLDPNTDPSTVIAMMNGPNAPRKARPVDLPKAKPKPSNHVQGDLFGAD